MHCLCISPYIITVELNLLNFNLYMSAEVSIITNHIIHLNKYLYYVQNSGKGLQDTNGSVVLQYSLTQT